MVAPSVVMVVIVSVEMVIVKDQAATDTLVMDVDRLEMQHNLVQDMCPSFGKMVGLDVGSTARMQPDNGGDGVGTTKWVEVPVVDAVDTPPGDDNNVDYTGAGDDDNNVDYTGAGGASQDGAHQGADGWGAPAQGEDVRWGASWKDHRDARWWAGGQGPQRTAKRRQRVADWLEGTWKPAWRVAQEEQADRGRAMREAVRRELAAYISEQHIPLMMVSPDSVRPAPGGESTRAEDAEEFYVNELLKPDHEQDWVAGVDRWVGPLPPEPNDAMPVITEQAELDRIMAQHQAVSYYGESTGGGASSSSPPAALQVGAALLGGVAGGGASSSSPPATPQDGAAPHGGLHGGPAALRGGPAPLGAPVLSDVEEEEIPLAPVEWGEPEVMDWDPQEGDNSGLMQQLVMRRINEARQLEDAQGEVDVALVEMREHLERHGAEGVLPELRWGVRQWVEEEKRGAHFMLQILSRIEGGVVGWNFRVNGDLETSWGRRGLSRGRDSSGRLGRIARREAQISAPRRAGRSRSPRRTIGEAATSSGATSSETMRTDLVDGGLENGAPVEHGVLAVANGMMAIEDGMLAVEDGMLAVADATLDTACEGERGVEEVASRGGDGEDDNSDSDATVLMVMQLPGLWTTSLPRATSSSSPRTVSSGTMTLASSCPTSSWVAGVGGGGGGENHGVDRADEECGMGGRYRGCVLPVRLGVDYECEEREEEE